MDLNTKVQLSSLAVIWSCLFFIQDHSAEKQCGTNEPHFCTTHHFQHYEKISNSHLLHRNPWADSNQISIKVVSWPNVLLIRFWWSMSVRGQKEEKNEIKVHLVSFLQLTALGIDD